MKKGNGGEEEEEGVECVTVGIVKDREDSFSITETQQNRTRQTAEHERTDLSTGECVCVSVCEERKWRNSERKSGKEGSRVHICLFLQSLCY